MREYELIYVIQPDATPEREGEIHTRVDEAIDRSGGAPLLRDDWGKRKLAYEIRKFQKGHYFQLNFLGDGKFIAEMERLLRIDPDVLRFLTVLVSDQVVDIDARVAEAKQQAEERAERRAEREKLEAERDAAAAQARESRPERSEDGGAPRADPPAPAAPAANGKDEE